MVSLAARFTASEWMVTLSGASSFTSSIVCLTSSSVSSGSPMMRSMFMLSKPSSRASLKLCIVSSTVWCLPIISSVCCFMVCGLTDIRLMPFFFSARSFSLVMESGLPASTVNSRQSFKSKLHLIFLISLSSCAGLSVVGVPPPM